jgi:heptosyltransferase-2
MPHNLSNQNKLKILIIAPAWLGDFVMMQSLLIELKKKYPDSIIDVISNEVCHPLAQFMPEIHKSIILKTQHGKFDFKARKNLGFSLKNKYDWAITLPITLKSALVPFFAKIPKRTGFLGEIRFGLINNIIALNKQKTPLMVDRYLSLIGNQKITSQLYPKFRTDNISQTKTIALCPGASYGLAKKWPIENFKQLAKILIDNNYKVFIFGSKAEQEDGNTISANNDNIINYAGILSLTESINKLNNIETVVTNDSGLMHISCALQKKVIAIFGSSTPKHTPPLNEKAIILETDLSCRPCFAKTCQYKHYNCLKKITVSQVLNHLNIK